MAMNASLRVLGSMATRAWLAACRQTWADGGQGALELEALGGVELARRLRAGEDADVVVLALPTLEVLAHEGWLVEGSVTALARSPMVAAVRAGDRRPSLGSEAELRAGLEAARAIGYSTGPSGDALRQILVRWQVLDLWAHKLVQAAPGVPVAQLLAAGQVDIGFQQQAELVGTADVEVIGTLPPGLEVVTTFGGAVCRASSRAEAAGLWLRHLRSPIAQRRLDAVGMQPAQDRPRVDLPETHQPGDEA